MYKDALANVTDEALTTQFAELIAHNLSKMNGTGRDQKSLGEVQHEHFLEIKYSGSDYSLMVQANKVSEFRKEFEKKYFGEFGFISTERELLVEAIRVRSISPQQTASVKKPSKSQKDHLTKKANFAPVYFKKAGRLARVETPIWAIEDLAPQSSLEGPAVILIGTGTVVVEPGFDVFIDANHNIFLKIGADGRGRENKIWLIGRYRKQANWKRNEQR